MVPESFSLKANVYNNSLKLFFTFFFILIEGTVCVGIEAVQVLVNINASLLTH